MASAISTSIAVVAWAASILFCGTYLDAAVLEAKALFETGWWSIRDRPNNISSPCEWKGITCNAGGSVIKIDRASVTLGGETTSGGVISSEIRMLKKLVFLNLGNNRLAGPIPSSIAHMTNLKFLSLSLNQINGSIPPEIGSLNNLVDLRISLNKLMIGPIPSTLANLTKLQVLFLSGNQHSGSIPPEIGMLKNLLRLDLSYNNLIGPLPSTTGNSTNLQHLNGSIPSEVRMPNKLFNLDLSGNKINGSIPAGLGNLKNLLRLNLQFNNITGSIPADLAKSEALEELLLSHNNLTGSIPYNARDDFYWLRTMDLSHNFISGEIPRELGHLGCLSALNLSHNNLRGSIPSFLISIKEVDLSYNYLKGRIPSGSDPSKYTLILIGNKDLCGDFKGFSPCHVQLIAKKIRIVVPITLILGLLALGGWLLSRLVVNKTQSESSEKKDGNLFSIWNYDGKIAYEDIIASTEDFDIKYCIGTGSYGSVYKAKLPCGRVVALKKLHRLEVENQSSYKSFKNEVKVLAEIRHRNIIKLYGFCFHRRCMFLIYEYMERGSLFSILANDDEAVDLDWRKRVDIIKGITHALSYMHHECFPAIVHRDISSKNILLNSKLEACVADFGTAKLLDPDSSNQTLLVWNLWLHCSG
ncbi:hypothetical protein CJ030_MR1G018138 [Morella rubra]|uniref:non-specific serine/threonine protein kinase n=1 Tax=Morella rubra TaxID=262757 RepID=A0A6A1WMM4_9ROSI|nr:hypothetical protein CJ030_MR1G018137 [Morella rubra]KAB1226532.1 hypothetical protein CJ030_MR1G018138 [Morella rubra]